jgi:hypothetical protein
VPSGKFFTAHDVLPINAKAGVGLRSVGFAGKNVTWPLGRGRFFLGDGRAAKPRGGGGLQ